MEIEKITPGLYKRTIGDPIQWTHDFSPNKIKLYLVHKEGEKLIATDMDGKNYAIEDPGFYDRSRRKTSEGSIDCFDLFQINEKNYKKLETRLLETQERTSKLLKMMEDNKANLSAQNGSTCLVDI